MAPRPTQYHRATRSQFAQNAQREYLKRKLCEIRSKRKPNPNNNR
jgi:hypothetical protein